MGPWATGASSQGKHYQPQGLQAQARTLHAKPQEKHFQPPLHMRSDLEKQLPRRFFHTRPALTWAAPAPEGLHEDDAFGSWCHA